MNRYFNAYEASPGADVENGMPRLALILAAKA
jgi:hypothetical protein